MCAGGTYESEMARKVDVCECKGGEWVRSGGGAAGCSQECREMGLVLGTATEGDGEGDGEDRRARLADGSELSAASSRSMTEEREALLDADVLVESARKQGPIDSMKSETRRRTIDGISLYSYPLVSTVTSPTLHSHSQHASQIYPRQQPGLDVPPRATYLLSRSS